MEYVLLLFEYIWIKRGAYLTQIVFCTLIGLLVYIFSDECILVRHSFDFHSNIMTVLGILTGFSISIFTVFLTIDNENVRKAKKEDLGRKLYGKEISLYDTLLIGLAYAIIVQAILLIVNFVYPAFVDIETEKSRQFFSINIAIFIHIILLLMRSILDFYFIITKKQ
jgi:hypothetical protein